MLLLLLLLLLSNGLCEHASMRAVRLVLRARAVINSDHASSEHFVIFSPAGIPLLKRFAPSNSEQDNKRNGRQHDEALLRFNHSQ